MSGGLRCPSAHESPVSPRLVRGNLLDLELDLGCHQAWRGCRATDAFCRRTFRRGWCRPARVALSARRRRGQLLPWRDVPRLALSALFLIPLTYTPPYCALRIVPSGVAAVLNSALTSLIMLLLGLARGEERWTHRQGIAIAIGILGLMLLFGTNSGAPSYAEPLKALGAAAACMRSLSRSSPSSSVLRRSAKRSHLLRARVWC